MRYKKLDIELLRIKGIPLRVNASWLIIFFLIVNSVFAGEIRQVYPQGGSLIWIIQSIVFAFLFFASLLMHELAHSIEAVKIGIDVSDITLYVFGGAAKILREPEKPADEIRMALAGPFVSFAICGISYLLHAFFNLFYLRSLSAVFYLLFLANLAVGAFNLIPAFPLDGGRVFRSLLWLKFNDRLKATLSSSKFSKFIAFLIFLIGIYLGLFILLEGLWLSFIAVVLFVFSSRSLEAAYQSEILNRKLKNVFDYEEISSISLPVLREIDYETTVLLKSDDSVYFALKLLRSNDFNLVKLIWNDEVFYLKPTEMLKSIYQKLENSKRYFHEIK